MNVLLKFLLVSFVLFGALFAFLFLPMIIADLPRSHFQRNLKKRASAAEMQAWAMKLLAPFQTNMDPAEAIEVTNLHAAFQGLDKWPPRAYVYADSQPRFAISEAVPYIKVTYGSAAGHFGLLLGPTNLPTPASRAHEIRYTTWAPGVWFFDGQ